MADVAVFENRQSLTEAKFMHSILRINKSTLFILLLGVIRRLELQLIKERPVLKKVENIRHPSILPSRLLAVVFGYVITLYDLFDAILPINIVLYHYSFMNK